MLFSSSRGAIPLIASLKGGKKELGDGNITTARFYVFLSAETLVFGACQHLVSLYVVKKNTVWYKATGLKLIENPHTVLWQQIVYLFVGCMCVPILQRRTEPICVYVCVRALALCQGE